MNSTSLPDPDQQALVPAIGKCPVKPGYHRGGKHEIQPDRPSEMLDRPARLTEHAPHPFKDMGRGIGPALEARDVLAVLQGAAKAPDDLRQRALCLAGDILEMGGVVPSMRLLPLLGIANVSEVFANTPSQGSANHTAPALRLTGVNSPRVVAPSTGEGRPAASKSTAPRRGRPVSGSTGMPVVVCWRLVTASRRAPRPAPCAR